VPLSVSLKTLQQKAQGKEKSTGKHSADLKDIIASVQKDLDEALPPTPPEPKIPTPKPTPKAEPAPTPAAKPETVAKPHEIPEAELKKMLEV
jgi:hypothetical protein